MLTNVAELAEFGELHKGQILILMDFNNVIVFNNGELCIAF